MSKTYPYDEVYSLVTTVLKDGVIDDQEKDMLKVFFADFIDTKTSYNINSTDIIELKKNIKVSGICTVCPEIEFKGKSFCFTGASSKSTRNEIKQALESLDGIFHENVTKKTDYLVIGDFGNPCWAYACYGRKVEKAVKLRKEGRQVVIIHENDFWDAVQEYV